MVRIEKDKILFTDVSNESHEIYPAEIPAHLGDTVELGEFVTFSRIFDLIVDNKSLFNIIFAKDLGYQTIEQYLEEYNKPVSHTPNSYDLEVHFVCQVHNYLDYRDFEYYPSFHGLGIPENDLEAEEAYPISVSFTSLNELKNKYISIDNQVQIFTYSEDGSVESSPVFDGDMKLFDFFAAILNEISFFGDPDSRDELTEEFLEDAVEEGSVEEEEINWEEMQAQWDQEAREAEQEEELIRLESLKEKVASGYISDFINSSFREAIEKLEMLEDDLVSLERYEDAKLVRSRIEILNSGI